jgi:photosystem II stability/assembly factor-like uncharacterized protein
MMGTTSDRRLFLGTADGLYVAEPNGDGFSARLVGLAGMGVLRASAVVDRDDPKRVYAGATRGGMYCSEDGGERWREINHGILHKDVWSIVQHPGSATLFAGTSPARVYRSDDRGESWSDCPQLETLPTTKGWTGPLPPHVSRMKCLSLSPSDPDRIYGAIEEGWAVRSLDGGATWQQIDEGMDHDGHAIAAMLRDPDTVVATGGKGLYRSEDCGDHWVKLTPADAPYRYTPADLAIHPARPELLYTAVSATGPGGWSRPEGPGIAFVRSEDEGQTWELIRGALPEDNRGVPRGLAVDPEEPETYYMGMTDGTVWVSEEAGAHFRQILRGLPAVHSVTVVGV